jgi:hypothetical protein
VEVKTGGATGTVPIILSEGGQVRMMESSLRLDDPPWLVFVGSFRETDEGGHRAPAARVFVDRSGQPSHNWQLVGWVGTSSLYYEGLHFQLVASEAVAVPPVPQASRSYAQLALDRDIGVPIVYLGFIVVSVGTLLMLGPPHRRVTALVRAGGKGSRIALSLSPGSDQREAERLGSSIESDLGGVREADPARAKEESCVS